MHKRSVAIGGFSAFGKMHRRCKPVARAVIGSAHRDRAGEQPSVFENRPFRPTTAFLTGGSFQRAPVVLAALMMKRDVTARVIMTAYQPGTNISAHIENEVAKAKLPVMETINQFISRSTFC